MTDSVAPSEHHDAKAAQLNEQRLRLTAARERIDCAARLLAMGEDWGRLCASEELRLALRALEGDRSASEPPD